MNPDLSWISLWLKEQFNSESIVVIEPKEAEYPKKWLTNETFLEEFKEFKLQYPTATYESYLEMYWFMSQKTE
jgi:hypothetical protein